MTQPKTIYLADTTLRDGHQAVGLALNLETREKIVMAMDNLGVARIEALAPSLTPAEARAGRKWSSMTVNAKIVAWNRLNLADIEASMTARPHIIHISFPA